MDSFLLLHILITSIVKLTIAQTVSLWPGPTVTVLVNSSATFSCTTTYSMRFLFIKDSTKPAGTTAVTLGNLKGVCSTLSLDSDYVVNCDTVIGPYNFTIKSVTSKFHNSKITCTVQYGSSTSIDIASAVTTILVKDFQLTTSSRRATTGVNFSFTCTTFQTFVVYNKDGGPYCVISGVQDGSCKLDSSCSSNNMYNCNLTTGTYSFTIPGTFVTNSLHNSKWNCHSPFGIGNPSIEFEMYIRIPVKTVTITPSGTNDQLDVVEGQTQTFTCTTSPCRPAAWIQWYIGTQNLTTQSVIHISEQDGNTFMSSSTLMYTWMSADHNKSMYCEAINFEEAQTVTSPKILIYIHSDFTLTGSHHFIISNQPFILNCSSHITPRGEAAYLYKDNISTMNIRYVPSTSTCYGIPQDSKPVFQCNDTCSCSEDARIFTWTYNGTVNNQRVTFKCGMDFGTNLRNITYRELTVERSLYVTPSNTPSVPTQKPDPPTNVSAVCQETSMTVFWRSGYNGGYTQSFAVVIVNSQTNQTTYYSDIPDQGETEIMEVTFETLSSTTLYIVSVHATNIFGIAELDAHVFCTTLSAPKTGQSDMISVRIGAGIGSAVIILVLTSIVVLFYKKRINENKERNSMYQTTESASEDVFNAEKHIYNELQHVKNDSSTPDHLSSDTSTYYNEGGTMTNMDTEHYQNINRHNEAAHFQDGDPPVYIDLNI